MKALGIVFSNLHDKNIQELTSRRTFASIPFGGRYRLIDFVLSSMVNSGVQKVGIITKANYQSLMDHCGSGKVWDLARKNGGLMILPPYGAASSNTLYTNRLEALQGVTNFLKHSKEEYVVMSDCDIVANVNYGDVIASHVANGADITLVYRHTDEAASGNRGIIELDKKTGRVKKFYVTPSTQGECNLYANIMVIGREFLLNMLELAGMNGETSFSRDILSRRTSDLRIYGYAYEGYFANIDSMANYFRHNVEMLDKTKRDSLFRKDSPIYTKTKDSAPVKYGSEAKVADSIIADGCVIEGTVENSVLFRGVHIAKGAVVRNCIIMQDSTVSADAEIGYVVADKNVVIREKRKLYGCEVAPYYVGKNSIL